MAVTVSFTDKIIDYLGDGGINLNTASTRAIPLTSAYTFSAGHNFASSLSGEVTASGGSRFVISAPSWSIVSNEGVYDTEDIFWSASGGTLTIRQFAHVDYTGSSSDADRELLAVYTNDSDLSAADGFTITFQTPNGLFKIRKA